MRPALSVSSYAPRKRMLLILLVIAVFSAAVISIADTRLSREFMMNLKLADMRAEIDFLKTMYRARQEEILNLKARLANQGCDTGMSVHEPHEATYSPEIAALVKNMTGTRVAASLKTKKINLHVPFVYHLLPHLMDSNQSMSPAFHMKGNRTYLDYVFGIPTVRRDKENYLLITLEHLLAGLTSSYENSTLIVVYVGDTDLEYVLQTARLIEARFPRSVESGLIEVISPSPGYYPDLYKEKPTLGDSARRFRWRTKQNLDAIFLMAYAHTKGTYYLMLEDDVICKPNYMDVIKKFTATTSITNPDWFFIEYCSIGGIGKLFKSAEILHFITFVQIFYRNMPIDWLTERYVETRACSIEIGSKECRENKLLIRPRHKTSLFQHIGLYSSLTGKIQKIKDSHFGKVPTFYPHENPPLEYASTTLNIHGKHKLIEAYLGKDFFWGITPTAGDTIVFCLKQPMVIESFLFRSGNVDHFSDKFRTSVVEVMPSKEDQANFTQVGSFDEFGLAEGTISSEIGPIQSIRIRVLQNHSTWVILSEIFLKPSKQVGTKVGATISPSEENNKKNSS